MADGAPIDRLPSILPVEPAERAPKKRGLIESLARYMHPQAFEPVPPRMKWTCKNVGKAEHDKRRSRRQLELKRAKAAVRFFSRPENRQWLDDYCRAKAAEGTHPHEP